MIDVITKYFPNISDIQKQQFEQLGNLYPEWNNKINVISRKDIDNLYVHHILHSLSIAKIITFRDGTKVMDFGTGGGFPGIPLAIMFPETKFHLIDSIGKKITVASEISKALQLTNTTFSHSRVEDIKEKYNYVVSRAVMQLPELYKVCRKNISKEQLNALPNGIICLKGGEIKDEIQPFKKFVEVTELENIFTEKFFEEKKIVYLNVM